jgi:phosphate uptake regulator
MEQRKLIKLGNSSFAIALPKGWVNKAGLKKGDTISLEESNHGSLRIISEYKSRNNNEKKIRIDLENKEESGIWREFNAAYVNGYDLFSFSGNLNKEKNDLIKKLSKSLVGLEITEKEGKLVIKDYFNLEETNMKSFLSRLDNDIKEMFEILIKVLEKKSSDKRELLEISEIDQDINRFYFLFSRIFFKGVDNPTILSTIKISSLDLFNYWWFSFNIEEMGDQIKQMVRFLRNTNKNQKKIEKILHLAVKLKEIYKESMNALYKNDRSLAMKTIEDGKKILDECSKLINDEDAIIARLALGLKEIEDSIYSNMKIIVYTREKNGSK